MIGSDREQHFVYLGEKALKYGVTFFEVRSGVEPFLAAAALGQKYTFNIQIVSLTDFLEVARQLGYEDGMELIYSTFLG